jgi:hypothetical protein
MTKPSAEGFCFVRRAGNVSELRDSEQREQIAFHDPPARFAGKEAADHPIDRRAFNIDTDRQLGVACAHANKEIVGAYDSRTR